MKKIKLIFGFLLFSMFTTHAQSTVNENNNYKITFLEIDQFQLKELVPVCTVIFDAPAGNKGEPDVLYFNSSLDITKDKLKQELAKKNITYDFKIEVIDNNEE